MEKAKDTSRASKPHKSATKSVVLLSGGNPQIAKADGDAPVQEYIAAMPDWKRDLGKRRGADGDLGEAGRCVARLGPVGETVPPPRGVPGTYSGRHGGRRDLAPAPRRKRCQALIQHLHVGQVLLVRLHQIPPL
jgi:hypothetical protein